MYLLDAHTYELKRFLGGDIPDYAILSHTWGGDEILFRDILRNDATTFKQIGFSKVKACCMRAIEDNLDFVWIDTCCIDSDSSAELSEAINSMYEWYKAANICYAYLSDVSENATQLKEARWFSRGWTLQELLAPQNIRFYDRNWQKIGDKRSLKSLIASAAGIQAQHLNRPADASVAQKMSWVSRRQTTRKEDIAYCLLGLFDVNMPLLYGEGETKAFLRLQQEIIRMSSDESIFAWRNPGLWSSGMLAYSPADFTASQDIVVNTQGLFRPPYTMTNKGLEFPLLDWAGDFGNTDQGMTNAEIIIPLACTRNTSNKPIAVHLRFLKRYADNLGTNPIESRPQKDIGAPTLDTSNIIMMRTRLDEVVEYHETPSLQQRGLGQVGQQRFFIPDVRSVRTNDSYLRSVLAKGQWKTPHSRRMPWNTQTSKRLPCLAPEFLFQFNLGTPTKLAHFKSPTLDPKSQRLFESGSMNEEKGFDGDNVEVFAENHSYLWCYGADQELSMFFSWVSAEGSMPDAPTPSLKLHVVKCSPVRDGALKFRIVDTKELRLDSQLTPSFHFGSGKLCWISTDKLQTQPPLYTIYVHVTYIKGLQSFA